MVTAMHGHGRATALHSLFLKYLGRTRGVQKCGATPHGSRLSRGALLLALQQPHDAVDVDGKARPSLALVAVEVRLALGDNALGVAIDDAPERLVVGRALGPEAALVGLGYGEHLDVVDAVAAAGARRGAGWQRKVLVFRHVRGDVGAQRHGEVPALPAETQPHHHDAGAIVLKHELAVAIDEVEEVLGDGYDLHRLRPLHTKRGPHRCRPLQVGDILRLAAPRRPRRLNVHVSRTLKAAASGE